jgi:antitoxin component YwqK of YwqJK toxin-antitoxin module
MDQYSWINVINVSDFYSFYKLIRINREFNKICKDQESSKLKQFSKLIIEKHISYHILPNGKKHGIEQGLYLVDLHYKTNYEHGLEHGLEQFWYSNGQKL